ncbi:MAG: hypothetical protein KC766_24890 [Myxococcales bacterium]|nr:hypothetical protein [Myxococcales bacterium]
MMHPRYLIVLLLAAPVSGCDKGKDAPPADAKTVAAFQESKPEAGSTATIQGLLQAKKGKAWPIVDRPGGAFVYCEMEAPPDGLSEGDRVVATGKVADTAMLKECSITPVKK